jgi:hypothetical protein
VSLDINGARIELRKLTGSSCTPPALPSNENPWAARLRRVSQPRGSRARETAINHAASNTRKCICEPTTASARPAFRSAATWTFIIAGVHTRALTTPRPIEPTSTRCQSAWQPNPGRRSTYRRGKTVQTTGATSPYAPVTPPLRAISRAAINQYKSI